MQWFAWRSKISWLILIVLWFSIDSIDRFDVQIFNLSKKTMRLTLVLWLVGHPNQRISPNKNPFFRSGDTLFMLLHDCGWACILSNAFDSKLERSSQAQWIRRRSNDIHRYGGTRMASHILGRRPIRSRNGWLGVSIPGIQIWPRCAISMPQSAI